MLKSRPDSLLVTVSCALFAGCFVLGNSVISQTAEGEENTSKDHLQQAADAIVAVAKERVDL